MAGRGTGLAALVLATLLSAAPAPQAEAARFDDLRTEIEEAIDSGEVPSLAVAVARGDEILWEEAFGWADVEAGELATPHTPYAIASVTKPFTATALMLLVERGVVDLDRPINDYLGDARIRSDWTDPDGATVLQVARHTAGLPRHHRFFPLGDADPPPLDSVIREHAFLVTPPGEEFRYSNLGYALLGRVVERADGRPLSRFLEQEVTAPLGLEHTVLAEDPGALPRRARQYDGHPLPVYGSDHAAASEIWACVHDLLRFGMFHAGSEVPDQRPILSPAARVSMRSPGPHSPGWTEGYGIGWSLTQGRGQRLVFHAGRMPGARAVLVVAPLQRLVVAVVANGASELPVRVAGRVLDRLTFQLPGTFQPATEDSGLAGRAGQFRARPPRGLRGRWRGPARLPSGGSGDLVLDVRKDGVEIGWSGPSDVLILDEGFQRGRMRALVQCRSGPEDGDEGPHIRLYVLSLWRRDGALAGDLREITDDAFGMPRNISLPLRLERSTPP